MSSETLARNSSVVILARANPTTANSRDSSCSLARLYRAGINLRRVRSPAAPKMTMTQGSPGRPVRVLLGAVSTAVWDICSCLDGAVSNWQLAVGQTVLLGPIANCQLLIALVPTTDYYFGSTCPPNFWLMADSIFSADVCSCLDRKRVYRAADNTSAGTASSIAAWIVQR